ncbi:hypothetical protein BCR41DRAFT_350006 [Lobosporangium transversale]|uniref:Uncharacterized protein n=1 Tax=Lobosporangium transversale TaxID=64571 RepID=A0A1Y2GU32_9FUNG|nr:hypothetical protein BCR41DRAFT_350006 [Lobosporangium transversale]ORZ21776.1 hypothetical protein BCR41DRAFT_350006 [Lobosporangium transversale]|eukprot:XP_021883027.1 hypothetical protein BCR41DRAFT_350006 [Lobosporangium transversale]
MLFLPHSYLTPNYLHGAWCVVHGEAYIHYIYVNNIIYYIHTYNLLFMCGFHGSPPLLLIFNIYFAIL